MKPRCKQNRNHQPLPRARTLGWEWLETRSLMHAASDLPVDLMTSRTIALSTAGLGNSAEAPFPAVTRLQNFGGLLSAASAGEPLEILRSFLRSRADELRIDVDEASSYIVTDQYTDERSGTTHLYFRQVVSGIEVLNADLGIHISARGEVLSAASSFVDSSFPGERSRKPKVTAEQALAALTNELGNNPLPLPHVVSTDAQSSQMTTVLAANHSGLADISASLVYVSTPAELQLAWRLHLQTSDQQHWYEALVAADIGEILYVDDHLSHASYRVFPLPLQSPNDGSRSLVVDPNDAIASPWGWHDTDGVAGADFQDTRGNNVSAQEDADANNTGGFRPVGGGSLTFDFPFDAAQDPALYQPAAITNAFYWVNLLHDIHYQYGFTEAAGNFQVNNYGRGGVGNDPVIVDIQDGDGGTDSFVAFPDGQSPRMSLYRRTSPYRDRAFDSDVLIHEFGHGISERLTGGPANTSALNAVQSRGLGEGWGDWWALMLTQAATDTKLAAYPIGNYAAGFAPNGPGIRRYPYSFDMAINPLTLNSFNGGAANNEQHKAGEIWCSVLWDMNWLLIDKHGFSADLFHGTGGNNLALQLVMDGLKLQTTNPSYLGARDAILAADVALTGGQNQTEIWTAFARRGMGFSASDGGGAGATTVVQAFDVPSSISGRVFRDDDANGLQNGLEPGLPGWTVFRDKNGNGVRDVATIATFNSVDTPRPIPDGPNTLSSRTISGLMGVITDINVTVNLTHPYDGELYLTLISPSNTPIILANYLGGSGDNYTNTVFDDEAATYISAGAPPFAGSFRPYFNLSQLDGRDPNGTWKLRMDDAVSGNTGTLLSWSLEISYGTPDPTTVTDANGNYSIFGVGSGNHQIREEVKPGFTATAPAGGFHSVVSTGLPISDRNFGNTPATFHVMSAAPTSSGARIAFDRDIDLSQLNLYDTAGSPFGPADFTLVGATVGNVIGSLIIDPNQRQMTFLKTSGVLAPDFYTLTLRSALNGFRDTSGSWLDGDSNGTSGGDYVLNFTTLPSAGGTITVSVSNFARGPQQSVSLPADGTSGIPLSFNNGGGVTSASFELRYNPALLTVTTATIAAGLPEGAAVSLNTATPGVAAIQFTSPTPLDAGTTRFVNLQADVPSTAPYRSKQLLDITNISLNSGTIAAIDDDGVQVVGYFADVSGNGTYSALDASLIARLAVGIDSGLEEYQLLDPAIVGDITGNGSITATDTSLMLQTSVGIQIAEVPTPLPTVSLTQGGPDPKLSIPKNLTAAAGASLTIPVDLDSIVNLTGNGLAAADLVIYFDPTVFEFNSAALGSLLAHRPGWMISSRIDPLPGRIDISLAGTTPLEGQFLGELVKLHGTVRLNAEPGTSAINLAAISRNRTTQLNEGYLTLIPAPTDAANDPIDGRVTIVANEIPPATKNTVRLIGEQLLITGSLGDDRILVGQADDGRLRVRIGNRFLGNFVMPAGVVVDALTGNDFVYVAPFSMPALISADPSNYDQFFGDANSKVVHSTSSLGAPDFPAQQSAVHTDALLQLLTEWQAEFDLNEVSPRPRSVRRLT